MTLVLLGQGHTLRTPWHRQSWPYGRLQFTAPPVRQEWKVLEPLHPPSHCRPGNPGLLGTRQAASPWKDCICEGTYFHGKSFATASVFTHKWTSFLMKRENMALEIEHSCVGSTTAFSWTSTHIPFWVMCFHMLLQIIFTFKCFLTYFTYYFLWRGRQKILKFPRYYHIENINIQLYNIFNT